MGVSSPAQAGTLDTGGVVLSWDDSTFFAPEADGNKTYKFQFANNSGFEVLSLKATISDKFGDPLGIPGSDLFVKPGTTGFVDVSFVQYSELNNGLGPYTLTLRVEHYSSSGLGATEVTSPITFLSRTNPSAGKTVRCINKKTLKIKTFPGTKCPAGWKKV